MHFCWLARLFAGLLLALFAAANPQRLPHDDARNAGRHMRRVNGPPVAPAGGVYATWVAGYNGPGNGGDSASAIAVDDSGNVYVTGGSDGIGSDYATVRCDSAGQQQWLARYTAYGNDTAYAIALDASGNVYVTGRSPGAGTAEDYATISITPPGNNNGWRAIMDRPTLLMLHTPLLLMPPAMCT